MSKTIDEVRTQKQALEVTAKNILVQLEVDTGCIVKNFVINRADTDDGSLGVIESVNIPIVANFDIVPVVEPA